MNDSHPDCDPKPAPAAAPADGAPCAFFDVDTRIIDPNGEKLIIGPRATPIERQLARLFQFADERRLPVVATTCVQTPPIASAVRDSMVHVRVEGDQEEALARAPQAREVFLERLSCGDGDANVAARVYDVFHVNPNAEAFLRRMNIRRWAVFGVSLEYCLRGATLGLCCLGFDVTLPVDAVVPSPRPYGQSSEHIWQELVSAGVRLQTTESFLKSLAARM